MKILWVYFDIDTGNYIHYNHGVGELDAIIRERGHDSALIYLREHPSKEEFLSKVENENPDIIFFPTNTHQWANVRLYSTWIKERFDTLCVAGGIHVICDPDAVIEHPAIDFICPWEGDLALPKFLESMQKGKNLCLVKGIWGKRNGKVVKNPPYPLIENLDEIPISDRTFWNMKQVLVDSLFEMGVMAGRGCPYSCAYCANSARKACYKGLGRFVRMRSPQRVIENIELLERKYYFKTIFIEDDIFTLDKKWAGEFLGLYEQNFSYPFKVYIHAEQVDRSILEELKDAGCYMVMAGVETGNEKMRARLLNRSMSNRQLVRVFRWCDEIGLKTWTFNIIGFPDETKKTIEELFELHQLLRPYMAQLSIYYPYPQTELYRICKKEGLLTSTERPTYFEKSILDLPNIDHESIQNAFWEFRDITLRIRAEKQKQGYYDLLDHLNESTIQTESGENIKLHLTKIWGEEHLSLFMHPRSSVVWNIDLQEKTTLHTAIALDPLCLEWGGGGVRFLVRCNNRTKGKILLDRTINPKKNIHQNRWHEIRIDLAEFSGKVELKLETLPEDDNDLVGAWSVWARPYLIGRSTK